MPITLLLALKTVKTAFFKLCIMKLIANFINYELTINLLILNSFL